MLEAKQEKGKEKASKEAEKAQKARIAEELKARKKGTQAMDPPESYASCLRSASSNRRAKESVQR